VIMRHPRASVGECTRPPAATQHLDPNASDPTAASRRTYPTCDALPACTSTVVYGMVQLKRRVGESATVKCPSPTAPSPQHPPVHTLVSLSYWSWVLSARVCSARRHGDTHRLHWCAPVVELGGCSRCCGVVGEGRAVYMYT
jgi:hypothetical protein